MTEGKWKTYLTIVPSKDETGYVIVTSSTGDGQKSKSVHGKVYQTQTEALEKAKRVARLIHETTEGPVEVRITNTVFAVGEQEES